jgi:2,3-diketo-5-methylthio-1-phosphopentane phosphatase
MKDFIFVSDFDGTMTERDFYLIVMDKYQRDWQTLNEQWYHDQITTFEFLAGVFAQIGMEEEQVIKDILSIKFDPNVLPFVNKVKAAGGDFAVLSAGADYYIQKVLAYHEIEDVRLIANKGVYENKGVKMTADTKSPYYSRLYGIDKGAVIQALKKEYKKVYFAGDSSPDLPAAQAADVAFARNELAKLLTEDKKAFISYTSFSTIKDYIF